MFTNYMQLALEQAFFAVGESRPNPAVGAVVVKDGIVVGKGRTQRPGSAHAEVMALRDAGELARGAAIYVTLEPCCHYGRTPPCTKAIIDAGIKQVYFAHSDPNPVVRGNSRRILEEAGIEVFEGADACIRAEIPETWDDTNGECHCLCANGTPDPSCHVIPDPIGDLASSQKAAGRYVFQDIERYFEAYDYFVRNKRTFVEIKSAVSEDDFMGAVRADGSHAPLKITGENANCWNHELRAMSDAILVGTGTLLADNPNLDVRYAQGNNPVKIVWAGHHEFTAEEVGRLNVFVMCHPEQAKRVEGSCIPSCAVLVFSCVQQPELSKRFPKHNFDGALPCHPEQAKRIEGSCDIVYLSAATFPENWRQMLDNLSARGMHRLMVEPGEGLARQLFAADVSSADTSSTAATLSVEETQNSHPLWNRLDLWKSTDPSVERTLDEQIASGVVSHGLEFPSLPENIVAKESAIIGPDVLTVYYPV